MNSAIPMLRNKTIASEITGQHKEHAKYIQDTANTVAQLAKHTIMGYMGKRVSATADVHVHGSDEAKCENSPRQHRARLNSAASSIQSCSVQ